MRRFRRYVVVPYDVGMARLWGRLKAQAQALGHPLGQNEQSNDLWVCATAMYHNAPLLTLNRRHFESFPVLSSCPNDCCASKKPPRTTSGCTCGTRFTGHTPR